MEELDELYNNVTNDRGDSTKSLIKTATNHFNAFLLTLHQNNPASYPYKSFNEITAQQLLVFKNVFGMFPDYLRNVANINKYGTTLNYLSKVKQLIEDKQPDTDILIGSFYHKTRVNTTKAYLDHAIKNGQNMRDSSSPMTADDVKYMCTVLFEQDNRTSLTNRYMIILQWQALGRISEVCRLSCEQIRFYAGNNINALQINIGRSKVSMSHNVFLFEHAQSWMVCPVHALGSLLALKSTTSALFEQVTEKGEANYVNKVLTDIMVAASFY